MLYYLLNDSTTTTIYERIKKSDLSAKIKQQVVRIMRRIKLVVGAIVATSACLYYNQYISTPLPIRALNLSTKCQFTLKSIRDEDVKVIKYRMSAPRPVEDMFTVVCGPRGIGKSTAINSAANGLRGVIKISSVKPGTSSDEILDDVCCKITGLRNGSWKKNEDSMKKVISWIQTFTGRSPVIIIPAGQRFEGNIAAGLTEAARILTTDYELNVVIDSAENALPTTLSGREFMIEMKPMTNEMMRKLPGFEDVFETLKKQGNEDIVMRLCAGRPIVLKQFKSKLELCYTEEEKLTAVNFYVREMLEKALERVAKHPEIKEVTILFFSRPLLVIFEF